MKNYPRPTTDRQEVLLKAIRRGYVDCLMIPFPGFRTRISELKLDYKVKFTPVPVSKKNRNGHKITIVRHVLKTQAAKDHALGVYMKMVKKAA